MKCELCGGTGKVIGADYMGNYEIERCPYCMEMAEEEFEALNRQENDVMLEIDEIDEELFFI